MRWKEFYEKGGMSVKEMEDKKVIEQSVEKRITERQRQVQGQEHSENIRRSRYNNCIKESR